MALFPCDRHGSRQYGPNFGTYVAIGSGFDLERYYLRLCTVHARELQSRLDKFKLDPDGYTVSNNRRAPACPTCGNVVDEIGRQLFVTHYPTKHDREDYWSQLHEDCPVPDILRKPDRLLAVVP